MRYIHSWECSEEEAEQVLTQSRECVSIDIETVDLENTPPMGKGLVKNLKEGVGK